MTNTHSETTKNNNARYPDPNHRRSFPGCTRQPQANQRHGPLPQKKTKSKNARDPDANHLNSCLNTSRQHMTTTNNTRQTEEPRPQEEMTNDGNTHTLADTAALHHGTATQHKNARDSGCLDGHRESSPKMAALMDVAERLKSWKMAFKHVPPETLARNHMFLFSMERVCFLRTRIRTLETPVRFKLVLILSHYRTNCICNKESKSWHKPTNTDKQTAKQNCKQAQPIFK